MKNGRILISIAAGGIIIGLFAVSIMTFMYRAQYASGTTIAEDVKKLATIFDQINKTCTIIDFDHQQNVINFLNVGTFTGSEIGPMNLAYPTKWQGPYVGDNLEIQGKEYMVVRTKNGYFITPGNGVKLPNDAIVGKDIILDENADIQAMMINKKQLYFQGRPLAAKITLPHSQPFADAWRMKY